MKKLIVLSSIVALMVVGQSFGAVITNSVTDFSLTQGENNWNYYYKAGAGSENDWVLAPVDPLAPRYYALTAPWVSLFADKQRTMDGPAVHMKREWTAPVDYSAGVDIDVDWGYHGNSLNMRVVMYDASAETYTDLGSAPSWILPNYIGTGTLSMNVASLSAGDKIYATVQFAGFPYGPTDAEALVDIDMTISEVPEPATMALLGLGGLLLRRRK